MTPSLPAGEWCTAPSYRKYSYVSSDTSHAPCAPPSPAPRSARQRGCGGGVRARRRGERRRRAGGDGRRRGSGLERRGGGGRGRARGRAWSRQRVAMRSSWALGSTAPEGFPGLHTTTMRTVAPARAAATNASASASGSGFSSSSQSHGITWPPARAPASPARPRVTRAPPRRPRRFRRARSSPEGAEPAQMDAPGAPRGRGGAFAPTQR